ncbi:MAG: lspA [Paenibacillus sp.]|jgi:signal peptidase II|nr:lspA [Paenibacillus sp.]
MFYTVALAVAVIDQLLKIAVRVYMEVGESAALWNGRILLTFYENSGAARSSFQGYGRLFIIVGIVVIAGLLIARRKGHIKGFLLETGAALLIGGAAGNTLDRILYGKVTDFLVMGEGILNAADLALSAGSVLLLLHVIVQEWKERTVYSRFISR